MINLNVDQVSQVSGGASKPILVSFDGDILSVPSWGITDHCAAVIEKNFNQYVSGQISDSAAYNNINNAGCIDQFVTFGDNIWYGTFS